jgi:hypothetical protein
MLDAVTDAKDKKLKVAETNDMLSYLEVTDLEKGDYVLQISVAKGHWLFTNRF